MAKEILFICSGCGEIDAQTGDHGDGMACPDCRPMKWMSRVDSIAGREYAFKFHGIDKRMRECEGCHAKYMPERTPNHAVGCMFAVSESKAVLSIAQADLDGPMTLF